MPRTNNIRWREQDKLKLQKTVRNFNAKVSRLANKSSELATFLPRKITTKELQSQIGTRQDFNRIINRFQRFSKLNSEKIVETKAGKIATQWEIQEAKIMWNTKESIKAKKRTKLKENEKSFTMGDIEKQELKPSKLTVEDVSAGKAWDKFVKSLESQVMGLRDFKKAEQYKESYLKAIDNNLGEKGKFLHDIINQIDAQILANKYWDDPVTRIQFISDPLNVDNIITESISHWGKALGWNDNQIEQYLLEFENELNNYYEENGDDEN